MCINNILCKVTRNWSWEVNERSLPCFPCGGVEVQNGSTQGTSTSKMSLTVQSLSAASNYNMLYLKMWILKWDTVLSLLLYFCGTTYSVWVHWSSPQSRMEPVWRMCREETLWNRGGGTPVIAPCKVISWRASVTSTKILFLGFSSRVPKPALIIAWRFEV